MIMTRNNLSRRSMLRTTAVTTALLALPFATARAAAFARATDGTKLYFEMRGTGVPIVFLHEVPGSCRSFDLQVGALEAKFQCIACNARGYPPSDVPPSVDAYSEEISVTDVGAVLDAANLKDAHVVGVSMGSSSALHFALREPSRVRSLILCAIGSGSDLTPDQHAANMEATAQKIEASNQQTLGATLGSFRQHISQRNPAAFRTFQEVAATLSPLGLANTLRGNQKRRKPIYAHQARLATMTTPTLVIVGDEDPPCIKPSRFLHETIPGARLETIPRGGHSINLEEPETFNRLVGELASSIDARGNRG
jgi:pimeloyl-ACP methyl ester carboxylesterase